MNVATKGGTQIDGEHDCGCGCGGGCGGGCGCGCVPSEFTRLRYAYGLRLGAVELSDEQSYLVGKHRFHNARLHGAGVLCGLRVDQFQFPQGSSSTTSTVLRVSRGAALDACGREVLVPVDQCIDVNAWFLKNGAGLKLAANTTTLPMRVAVRYRECPSDPAPVPRDPCGCDDSGCDYTRVREGFELRLFAQELPDCSGDIFPNAADLLKRFGMNVPALTPAAAPTSNPAPTPTPRPMPTPAPAAPSAPTVPDMSDLISGLDELASASCPEPKNEWICLADFTATLNSSAATVTSITAPDNTIPGRHVLLSTAAIQTLVIGLAGAFAGEGFLGTGPTLGALSFTSAGAATGTLNIAVNLITDPPNTSPTVLAFNPAFLQLFEFGAGGWTAVTPQSVSFSSSPAQISVTLNNWASGQPYRVSLVSPDADPIVDMRLRPLRPANYSGNFQLGADPATPGNLILVPLTI
jgi:hypothetical protein